MANFILVHGAGHGAWADPTLSGANVAALRTGHDPMICAPEALIRILLDCAA